MDSRKYSLIKNNKRGQATRTSNPCKKLPDDDPKSEKITQTKKMFEEKNILDLRCRQTNAFSKVFKRNLQEKKMKLELFLIKENDDSELKSLRGKMNEVIYHITDEIKELFFKLELVDNLPKM
ncbi:hypothetical protein TUBRATIS_24470, partial [Tubulinosema ratisbonensis]